MGLSSRDTRIGMVLSAGGLRGAAHLGVLRRVVRRQIPLDVVVGVSAGAIIAAYYAAVGLSVHEMIDQAPIFRGRHIFMHGVTVRAHELLKPYLRRFCGIIPERLEQLESASFNRLHHGVERLGIVCHDMLTNRPCYFSTSDHHGARLADVARASAAVPGVLPPKRVTINGASFKLADGGISDSLPIDFAKSPGLGATHLIVSDCRLTAGSVPRASESLIYIRPDLDGLRPLHGPRAALMKAVWQGEAAVTDDILDRIQSWARVPALS